MVTFERDPDKIKQILATDFHMYNRYTIEEGVVNVPKDSVRSFKIWKHLPVQFGYVDGFFDISGSGVTSLVGSPHTVGDGFHCRATQIKNLLGGPRHVEKDYWCTENPELISLEGAPETLKGKLIMRYSARIALLRLLQYDNFHVQKLPVEVHKILDKYKGQGKKGALACAAELIKAGYKDNARW